MNIANIRNVSPLLASRPLFVFDVESVGLYGDAFAYGWVLVKWDSLEWQYNELDTGFECCSPDKVDGFAAQVRQQADNVDRVPTTLDDYADRKWVNENIHLEPTCRTNEELQRRFVIEWRSVQEEHPDVLMAAECPFPVETNFLRSIVFEDPDTRSLMPYPLLDITSIMTYAGLDPMAQYPRIPSEEPAHDPLADSRLSVRLLQASLRRMQRCPHETH